MPTQYVIDDDLDDVHGSRRAAMASVRAKAKDHHGMIIELNVMHTDGSVEEELYVWRNGSLRHVVASGPTKRRRHASRASAPTVLGAGLLYIARDPARLVFEDASGFSELPIDVELDYPGSAMPGSQASGGYRLFMLGGQTASDARYLATHFASGEAREFQLKAPAGFLLPADYSKPPPIAADGRLLVPLAGDQLTQLHATKDGDTWEPVGRPIAAKGNSTTTLEQGGTVIFQGYGDSVEVPGALPASATQLIGPQGGEGIELIRNDSGSPKDPVYPVDEISADGACLAYFRSGTLHVVEVADYSSSDLGLPAEGTDAAMAWIPLPE